MDNKNSRIYRIIERIIRHNSKNIDSEKLKRMYIIMGITEILSVIFILIYLRFTSNNTEKSSFQIIGLIIVVFSIGFIFINMIMGMKNSMIIKNYKKKFNIQDENIKRIHNLNNSLRAQRHDFLNNLQVVYSLIQMEEFKEASDYIEQVYKDIKKVSRVLKTSNAAINALLQAKITDAESKGIKVSLNITSRLEDIKKESWEICRILSNLLDNAIFELVRSDIENKSIAVGIHESLEEYTFRVANNGTKIPDDIKEKIFQANFTTKGEKGQGMGLAIIKELVEKFGGELNLHSTEEETYFEVIIPNLVFEKSEC